MCSFPLGGVAAEIEVGPHVADAPTFVMPLGGVPREPSGISRLAAPHSAVAWPQSEALPAEVGSEEQGTRVQVQGARGVPVRARSCVVL